MSHFKQQAFPEAELFYREAIRAEPKYSVAHVGLGNSLRFKTDIRKRPLRIVMQSSSAAIVETATGRMQASGLANRYTP